jgi:hypothetical protein
VFVTGGALATGCRPPHPVTNIAAQHTKAASETHRAFDRPLNLIVVKSAALSTITIEPRS